jgi:hypothetical protein
MTSILEWPGVWFGLLFSPEKTAKQLKSERPGLVDGLVSFGLLNFILGILMFLVALALSFFLSSAMSSFASSWAAGGLVIMLAVFFGVLVIAYPIIALIGLLIVAAFFKLASVILKGRSSYSELCGMIGVVGSVYYIVMVALILLIYVPMVGAVILLGGSLSVALALAYALMGVAYLITMPFLQMVMALFFDLLADIEKVSIYRSGAMTGLAFGIVMFLLMLAFAAMMFLMGSMMGGYQNSGYRSYN